MITNNNIHDNPQTGIILSENASARIGFLYSSDSSPSPNTIQNNGGRGIDVSRSSYARIVGNTIANNTGVGIGIYRVSQADIASNTINNNGGGGIGLSQNSGVELGEDSPTTFFHQPNITTGNNTGYGISCNLGGYVRGHLGSLNPLNGSLGQTDFSATCPNNLVTP